jgi:alpha-L-fucosidase
MKSIQTSLLLLALGLLSGTTLRAEDAKQPVAGPLPHAYPQRLQWWADGRFGMFIHWGPVSLKETEISWSRANSNPKCPNNGPVPVAEYDNLYKKFNPTDFNAKEWVATAKAAGMKYMVLTVKHCDGFLLWDSKVSDYNIMHTPFKRDVAAELAKAAHEQGMKIGWYYSPMDWRDPDCRSEHNDRFVKHMQEEIRELLTNYGKIDLLWFDTDGCPTPWDQERTYAMIKKLQPEIVIDNRLDIGDPGSAPAASPASIGPHADYYTPEQFIGGFDIQHPWESCMTTSKRDQWSWGGHSDGVKSFETIMEMLICCAGGDGNVLLNVGPMPNGEISPEQATLIKKAGAWLAKNGESIYGTRGGPFKPGAYGVSTRKGNTIYVHIRKWADDTLKLPAIPAKVLSSRVVGGSSENATAESGRRLPILRSTRRVVGNRRVQPSQSGGKADVRQTASGIEISVPEGDRNPIDTIVALELDVAANQIPAVDVPRPVPLSEKAKATASNIYQNSAEFGADKAVDGNGDTRWATDTGVHQAWLELDLGQPMTFKRASISEAFPKRVQKFELQWFDGKQWKTFCTGSTLGDSWSKKFDPVTAQRVRLNVLESTEGPTIREFQLFK